MRKLYGENGLPPEWRENVANSVKGRTPWNKGKVGFKKALHKSHKKFSYQEFLEMKQEYAQGIPAYKLGLKYGCSHHTILKLIRSGFTQ